MQLIFIFIFIIFVILLFNHIWCILYKYMAIFVVRVKKFASPSVGFLSIEPIITLPKDYSSLPSYLSFDVFSPLVTIFYIFTAILIILVPYLLFFTYKNLIEKEYRNKFVLIFLFFSILFFFIPLSLLVIATFTAIPSLLFFLYFTYKVKYIERILLFVISYLEKPGFLTFLNRFYSRVFFSLTDIEHFFFIQSLLFISLGYLVISRFYFFFVITHNLALLNNVNYLLLSLSLYLCLCIWSLRLLLNLSFFIVTSMANYHSSGNKPIFLGEIIPPSPSDISTPNPNLNPGNSNPPPTHQYSLWNRHTYTNYHSYSRPRWYYYGNLTLGSCSLLLGCVGAYIGYQMWQTTERSNIALDKNSQAINRQSDQADVDAGRMTTQEYMDKWFSKKK